MAKKRDNGTGTIYQRSNGTWTGKIYLGKDPDGKERFKYLSGKTEAGVKRKIRDFNRSGTVEYKRSLPFDEYVLSCSSLIGKVGKKGVMCYFAGK